MALFRGKIVSFDSGTHAAAVRLDGSGPQVLAAVPATKGIAAADVSVGDRVIVDTGDHHQPDDFVVTAVFPGAPAVLAEPPTGGLMLWPTSSAPSGWLIADGAAVSRTTYADLFAVLGTAYGAGDGSTTFNLPNLKGRVPVGYDSGQTEFDTLGETGGAKTHTLTSAEMPSHTHVQDAHTHTQDPHQHGMSEGTTDGSGTLMDRANAGSGTTTVTDNATATNQNTTATNQNTGGGGAHNNLQPYIALHFIIKT